MTVFPHLCQVFVERIYNQLLIFLDHGHELLELSLAKLLRNRHPRAKCWAQPVHYLTLSVHPFTRKTKTQTHTQTWMKEWVEFISCFSLLLLATVGSHKIKTRSTTLLFFFTGRTMSVRNDWRVREKKVCSLIKKKTTRADCHAISVPENPASVCISMGTLTLTLILIVTLSWTTCCLILRPDVIITVVLVLSGFDSNNTINKLPLM